MRVLFVNGNLIYPLDSGGRIRRWNMLQALLEAGPTDALVFCRPEDKVSSEVYAGCQHVFRADIRYLLPTEQFDRLYQSTLGRGRLTLGKPYPFQYPLHDLEELRARLRDTLDLAAYDVIWFGRADLALAVGPCPSAATILDGDDFEYVREGLLLWHSPWYGAKLWNYLNLAKLWWLERSFPRRFTRVVRCSEEDRQRQPAPNVVVIPNGTDVPDEALTRTPERRLLFVGMIGYGPNAQGLEWFLQAVWPRVRQSVPDAELDIVGKGAPPWLVERDGQDGVRVHGFVHDLEPFYASVACAVVPLLAGGGTRLKILEAIGRKTPVVSTTLGAFGLDLTEAHGVYRADDPAAFASQCAALLEHPEQADAAVAAGWEHVRQRYDWRVIRRQVADLVRQVAHQRRARQSAPGSSLSEILSASPR